MSNYHPKDLTLTKLSILDWLGSAIAGGKEKPAQILSKTLAI